MALCYIKCRPVGLYSLVGKVSLYGKCKYNFAVYIPAAGLDTFSQPIMIRKLKKKRSAIQEKLLFEERGSTLTIVFFYFL